MDLAQPEGGGSAQLPDTEAAVETALKQNPEIEAAVHQLGKARAAWRAARAEYIPEIGAFAQQIYQDGAPFLSRNNGAFGLRMTWTVFEFGRRSGQVSERTAQIAEAEENLARLRNRLRIDVEKALRKLNRAETGVLSARDLLAATTESLRVASDQAEAGTTNRSTSLEAQASMLAAQADLVRAEYDRSVAAADVARLVGKQ
jgi:outer membrane protein TolC